MPKKIIRFQTPEAQQEIQEALNTYQRMLEEEIITPDIRDKLINILSQHLMDFSVLLEEFARGDENGQTSGEARSRLLRQLTGKRKKGKKGKKGYR